MRIDRFFITEYFGDEGVRIHDVDLLHQWKNVFRYQVGAKVILFNGDLYEYLCVINTISNREAECLLLEKRKASIPNKDVWLFLSSIRKEKFEMVVEKATELGVSHIVPMETEFSNEKRLNMKRLLKIAREASEQCGRGNVPDIRDLMTCEEALMFAKKEGLTLYVGDREGDDVVVKDKDEGALFIGPEGGWSEKEKKFFEEMSARRIKLGDFVLRAETAAIVGISKFL